MDELTIRPLSEDTWNAFVALCDRHSGGGFGGCYCTWFHRETHSAPTAESQARPASFARDFKHDLVRAGRAHAALVFDGDVAIGWAQYGSPAELPGIMHRRQVESAGDPLPDWRITCVFVDRRQRHRGIAHAAVAGALELIAEAGGGVVETYPQDTPGQPVSATFLYNATRSVFEAAGFTYIRPKGKNHCVMRAVVPAVRVPATS